MVSHPELGSDPPIGLDREMGCDTVYTGDQTCVCKTPREIASLQYFKPTITYHLKT